MMIDGSDNINLDLDKKTQLFCEDVCIGGKDGKDCTVKLVLENFNLDFDSGGVNKNNFDKYKILLIDTLKKLVEYNQNLLKEFENTNIDHKMVGENLNTQHCLSKILEKFCDLRMNTDLPLSYLYLSSVAHKLKIFSRNMEEFIKYFDNKEISKMINKGIQNIEENIGKLSLLQYENYDLFVNQKFVPYNVCEKTIKSFSQKNIKIQNNIPADWEINSYKEVFEIVLDNLISNALKFTHEGGSIEISLIKNKYDYINNLTFEVKDSGIGVADGVDLFEKGSSNKGLNGEKGTGVGLFHCKVFLDVIKGSIDCDRNFKNGSRFYFELPRID